MDIILDHSALNTVARRRARGKDTTLALRLERLVVADPFAFERVITPPPSGRGRLGEAHGNRA